MSNENEWEKVLKFGLQARKVTLLSFTSFKIKLSLQAHEFFYSNFIYFQTLQIPTIQKGWEKVQKFRLQVWKLTSWFLSVLTEK